jgi:hypothetical protein
LKLQFDQDDALLLGWTWTLHAPDISIQVDSMVDGDLLFLIVVIFDTFEEVESSAVASYPLGSKCEIVFKR